MFNHIFAGFLAFFYTFLTTFPFLALGFVFGLSSTVPFFLFVTCLKPALSPLYPNLLISSKKSGLFSLKSPTSIVGGGPGGGGGGGGGPGGGGPYPPYGFSSKGL